MERKLKPAKPDSRSVEIDDVYGLEFWTKEFNVTEKKLKTAVATVGTLARDVKRELKK